MLIFCNNFFSGDDQILIDHRTNHGYTLIQKNGTQSLTALARQKPDVYSIVHADYLIANNIKSVDVFVRDPIERYKSGLTTQIKSFGISKLTIQNLMARHVVLVLDGHTVPQFYTMLSIDTQVPGIEFNVRPLEDLAAVDPDIGMLNKNSIDLEFDQEFLDRIDHLFTPDVVLYNQFLNKRCQIKNVIEQIKKEQNYMTDLLKYRHELSYLL